MCSTEYPLDQLKDPVLPSLLTFSDGRPVTDQRDWLLRREEIKQILLQEEYGTIPEAPNGVRVKWPVYDENALAGKAVWIKAEVSFDTPNGPFCLPFDLMLPKSDRKVPVFVMLSFEDTVPNKYYPAEEIADQGYAAAMFHYEKAAGDSAETADNGLGSAYGSGYTWGTIAKWSFAASRIADALQERKELDMARLSVIGHSRLGKAALLAGALDERFSCTVSNDSGCSGAALFRGKNGERIKDITERFPYWFCEEFRKYAGKEEELPFDQHFLLSLTAPRYLYVASAAKDLWADPAAEFRGAMYAQEAYNLLGFQGLKLSSEDESAPKIGTALRAGKTGYHLRDGMHYLSREDWNLVIAFLNDKQKENAEL